MNNEKIQQTPYLIPLAIIVAGALIAGGIYFGNGTKSQQAAVGGATGQATEQEIAIAPVTSNDRVLGNPNADIVMVEYSDTQCPFCKQFHTTLHQVIDNYGKDGNVAWVYRHFPIDQLHKKARKEAEASECAAEQGGNDTFWKYIDQVYTRTASNDKLDVAELPKIANDIGIDVTKFNECLSSGRTAARVQEQYQDAQKSGGNGTPYTVFVLKEKVSDEVVEFVASANSQFGAQPGNEVLLVSKDKKRISMSGALPYSFVEAFIKVLEK